MRDRFRTFSRGLAALVCTLLAACTTVYQPFGPTGGYRETSLGDNRYLVEFHGNGNTSKDAVWNYWIYRCADLTRQKGFAYFTALPKAKTSSAEDGEPSLRTASDDSTGGDLVALKGSSGGGYVYVPSYGGGRITTWTSSATIVMFKSAAEAGDVYLLNASVVLDTLKTFIATQGREHTMASAELLRIARVATGPGSESASAVPASVGGGARVEMKDLSGLLPH